MTARERDPSVTEYCAMIWGSHGCALDPGHRYTCVCGCGDRADGRAEPDLCGACGELYMTPLCCRAEDLTHG